VFRLRWRLHDLGLRRWSVCTVIGSGTICVVSELEIENTDEQPSSTVGSPRLTLGKERHMAGMLALSGGAATLLWILAVVLVIMGIVSIVRGGVLAGVVLVIVGLLVGPGGVSLF
jgi:hypothetical protein